MNDQSQTSQQQTQQDDTNLDELLKKAQEESAQKENETEKTLSRDEELEQAKDQALRSMAELQNARRRMEEERQQFIRFASSGLMTSLLPVLDNFERAFSAIPAELQGNEWIKGIQQIEKTFKDALQKEGLETIAPKQGEDFNASLHEGLMQDPNIKNGKISQCFESGYQLKGKVLRVAKVSVGSKT